LFNFENCSHCDSRIIINARAVLIHASHQRPVHATPNDPITNLATDPATPLSAALLGVISTRARSSAVLQYRPIYCHRLQFCRPPVTKRSTSLPRSFRSSVFFHGLDRVLEFSQAFVPLPPLPGATYQVADLLLSVSPCCN
jgi:hypothetical protein